MAGGVQGLLLAAQTVFQHDATEAKKQRKGHPSKSALSSFWQVQLKETLWAGCI